MQHRVAVRTQLDIRRTAFQMPPTKWDLGIERHMDRSWRERISLRRNGNPQKCCAEIVVITSNLAFAASKQGAHKYQGTWRSTTFYFNIVDYKLDVYNIGGETFLFRLSEWVIFHVQWQGKAFAKLMYKTIFHMEWHFHGRFDSVPKEIQSGWVCHFT